MGTRDYSESKTREEQPGRDSTSAAFPRSGSLIQPADDSTNTNLFGQDSVQRLPVLITLDGRRVSERFVLTRPQSVIGRDLDVDVMVADGEVSRRHTMILWKNHDRDLSRTPECTIRDLGSTNGTYLNGGIVQDESPLRDGDLIRVGSTTLGFFIKDKRVLELDQLLLQMALHDSLTGVYKREYFFQELHREFDRSQRHNRPLSIGIIDIDHFKQVNDAHGHLCGDEALRQFADLVRLSLREGDICGRFGGEEFAVVFPETDAEGAWQAAERIREAVENHEFVLSSTLRRRITVSVGVATRHDSMTDKMQLMDAADQALYEAKQTGRNRSCSTVSRGALDSTILRRESREQQETH